jgi:diacylglycerol kinase
MDKHDIPFLGDFYTKTEVDAMVAAAVDEARAIDEASMAEHNFKATIISMILGFVCLALFLDGTLRLLGIIPPFMDIDISIVDKIADKVETEVLPLINQAKDYIPKI